MLDSTNYIRLLIVCPDIDTKFVITTVFSLFASILSHANEHFSFFATWKNLMSIFLVVNNLGIFYDELG